MLIDHWAVARQIQEDTGLSAADILKLDMDKYAKLSQRPTPAQAALEALGYADESPAPAPQQAPAGEPEPVQEQPQSLDPDSPEYFHAWRANRARGGEGKGIFDSVGSRSDAYTAAVRQQAGRTAYSQGNVTEAPKLDMSGRWARADLPIQGRAGFYR